MQATQYLAFSDQPDPCASAFVSEMRPKSSGLLVPRSR
jgi:hypothetical protein